MGHKKWEVTIDGTSPPLTVYERPDRDNQLYLRWAVGKSHKRPKLKKLATVRRKDGTKDPVLVTRAQALAVEQYREAQSREAPSTPEPELPLTLIRGFEEVLAIPGGKYGTEGTQWQTMRRIRDRVLSVLDPDTLWSALWPKDFRLVWRTLASRAADGESDLEWRAVEETVQMFVAASNWLGGEGGFLPAAPQPPKRWRESLKRDWEEITGHRIEVYRPRHTSEELDRLWKNLHRADPRLVLWAELGGFEYRGGQVLRGTRRDLDLTPGAGAGHGVFRIHGRGRKKGERVFLTLEQRAAVDHVLGTDGYLSDLEAKYQQGKIKDYPLWPGGMLRKGKARDQGSVMNRRTMLDKFKELEALADVPYVPSRGWYGVRRSSADRVRRFTTDERVKNASGGWSAGSKVRATVYEDGTDPEVLRETAEARRQARRWKPRNPQVGAKSPSKEEAIEALQEALGVAPEKLAAALTLLGVDGAS